MGCHVWVCVCVRMCERERERVCESGFVFKIAPQSTAVQKDEAPKPWALLGYPQCSARWLIHPSQQRWKWEENGWFECFPLTFFFFFIYSPQLSVPLVSQKGKQKNKNSTFVSMIESFTVTCRRHGFGKPHGCTSLCLRRKGKRYEKSSMAGWALWWEEREREREYRRKAQRIIWNICNVIIYELISCLRIDSYGFTPITAMAIIYICSIYCSTHRFYI